MTEWFTFVNMGLQEKQKELLKLLSDYIEKPLTIRELQNELELSSPSLVLYHIKQLEKKKYLKRNPSNPKDYKILKYPTEGTVYINLYGLAQCGPEGTVLSGDPIDRIPLSSKLLNFSLEDAFMVQALGNSMSPRINEGDFVIAKEQKTAEENDVLICSLDSTVMIKKFSQIARLLISINPEYNPIIINEDSEFIIEGVVKSVITSLSI